ncbi:beta-lactamase/transpeptidase-like protein [Apiosordaria backusii]|uniref:Beta-lactamase/transpeptidase-like protein n=1 Tax=Apiosordaria backusii TaxID=314023 RepID=A0AA40K3R8_9PEZI|nr:beta-lactamase/transpeptidase-like protein [Apiosordaria backusii]
MSFRNQAALISRLQEIAPVFEQVLRAGGAPGASICVDINGSAVFRLNLGIKNISKQQPPNSDTLYGVASVTKTFTASGIALLVDDGKLAWDTPIKLLLPEVDLQDPDVSQKVTILDLLTHRTGMGVSNQWWYGAQGDLLIKDSETVRYFNSLPQVEAFPSKFRYSNWNYDLLGKIIEKTAGVPYGQFIQAYREEGGQLKEHTHPKSPLKLVRKQLGCHVVRSNESQPLRGYGFGSTYITLPNTLGFGCNSNYYSPMPTVSAGDGHPVVIRGHGGSMAGHTTTFALIPEDEIAVVALTNSIGLADPTDWIVTALLETLLDSPEKHDVVECAKTAAAAHTTSTQKMQEKVDEERRVKKEEGEWKGPRPLEEYVGLYKFSLSDFVIGIHLDEKNEELEIRFQNLASQAWRLKHHIGDTFVWMDSRDEQAKRARFTYSAANVFKIVFRQSGEGTIDGLSWPQEGGLSEDKQVFANKVESVATDEVARARI